MNFHAKSGVCSSKNSWVIALGTKENISGRRWWWWRPRSTFSLSNYTVQFFLLFKVQRLVKNTVIHISTLYINIKSFNSWVEIRIQYIHSLYNKADYSLLSFILQNLLKWHLLNCEYFKKLSTKYLNQTNNKSHLAWIKTWYKWNLWTISVDKKIVQGQGVGKTSIRTK